MNVHVRVKQPHETSRLARKRPSELQVEPRAGKHGRRTDRYPPKTCRRRDIRGSEILPDGYRESLVSRQAVPGRPQSSDSLCTDLLASLTSAPFSFLG